MSCSNKCCAGAKAAGVGGHNWPNKRCKPRGKWFFVDVTEPSYIEPLESAPAVLWYINGPNAPDGNRLADTTLLKGKDGFAYLRCPGRWWIYYEGSGTECFKLVPTLDPLTALLQGILTGAVGTAPTLQPTLRTGKKAVTGADVATQFTAFAPPPGVMTLVIADPGNIDTVFIAGSETCPFDAAGGYPLAPGDTISLGIKNWDTLWFSSPDAAAQLRLIAESPAAQLCS